MSNTSQLRHYQGAQALCRDSVGCCHAKRRCPSHRQLPIVWDIRLRMQVVANEPSGASSLQTGDTTWETNVRCRKIWSQGKGGIGVLHAWSLVPRSVPSCLSASIRPTQTFLVSRLDSAAHNMRHNMQHRLPPLGAAASLQAAQAYRMDPAGAIHGLRWRRESASPRVQEPTLRRREKNPHPGWPSWRAWRRVQRSCPEVKHRSVTVPWR